MKDIEFYEKNPKIKQYVQFFGFSSPKKRYFIPSKKNYFDGIQFPFCMFDTGCRSHLLPMDNNVRTTIFTKYSDKSLFEWNVTGGKGVAAVQSPKLSIEKRSSGKFSVEFSNDILPFCMEIDGILKFHLAFEDAEYILDNGKSLLSKKSAQILFNFLEMIKYLKDKYPKSSIAQRRNHVLIGQDIIGEFSLVQTGKIFVAVRGKEYVNIDSELESSLTLIGKNSIFSNFNHNEFENLEDDDHNPEDEEIFEDDGDDLD